MASPGPVRAKIVIVGAGFGGLGMGVELKKAGEDDFIVLEKRSGVGGVWRDNTFPGCTCDVPSHLYSFSFATYKNRTQRYPPQREILEYLQKVATDFGLQPHLRPDTEVSQAYFCQDNNTWEITTTSGQHVRAEIVVFAVGQLQVPYYPEIPGREGFGGSMLHSAEWNHSIEELRGKRISIIGTGSSAAQMLPALASASSSLTVYQRTPSWVLLKPGHTFSQVEQALLRLPGARRLYRKTLSLCADMFLSPIVRSRAWRQIVERYARYNFRRQVKNQALVEKLLPRYPMGSKRIVFDNHFYATLDRPDVELVTEPITSIHESGIETEGGAFIAADIIVCATGFRTTEFLLPMTVRGRDGRCLQEEWSSGAEAFLGLAVHGYPNMFMIAGPNSFNAVGSNTEMEELKIAYIVRCLRWKEDVGTDAIEVAAETTARYQEWVRRKLSKTVWAGPADSWYKHKSGKVTNPWPASVRAFAKKLRGEPRHSFTMIGSRLV